MELLVLRSPDEVAVRSFTPGKPVRARMQNAGNDQRPQALGRNDGAAPALVGDPSRQISPREHRKNDSRSRSHLSAASRAWPDSGPRPEHSSPPGKTASRRARGLLAGSGG